MTSTSPENLVDAIADVALSDGLLGSLPAPALDSLADCLIADATSTLQCCSDKRCDDAHKRTGIWCKDLSNLSAANFHLRSVLWGQSLRILHICPNEDLAKLESCVPIRWRDHIHEVIIKVYPASPQNLPTSLPRVWVKRLNVFLNTCTQLRKVDVNCIATVHRLGGPSLHLPKLENLHIAMPSLLCQAPIPECFPNIKTLTYEDGLPHLLVPLDVWVPHQRSDFNKMFGEGFKSLTRLTLAIYLPSPLDEVPAASGDARSWTYETPIKLLRGKLPALKDLCIEMNGGTQKGARAYDLLPMTKWVAELKSPIETLTVNVGEISTYLLALLATQNGYRVESHPFNLQDHSALREGWTQMSKFTPTSTLINAITQNLAQVSTISEMSICQKATVRFSTTPGQSLKLYEAIYRSPAPHGGAAWQKNPDFQTPSKARRWLECVNMYDACRRVEVALQMHHHHMTHEHGGHNDLEPHAH